MRVSSLSPVTVLGRKLSSTIAYLIIPKDIDRESYIKNALRSSKVLCVSNSGEQLENVKVIKSALNDLVFPEKEGEKGSCLLLSLYPKNKEYICVGVIPKSDEYGGVDSEGEFSFCREYQGSLISVKGSSSRGALIVSISGKKGNLIIDNSCDSGYIEVNSSDQIKLYGKNIITEKSKLKQETFERKTITIKEGNNEVFVEITPTSVLIEKGDSKININSSVIIEKGGSIISLTGTGIKINSNSPIEFKSNLGDLKKMLSNFIQEVAKSTTATGPLLNSPLILKSLIDLELILK